MNNLSSSGSSGLGSHNLAMNFLSGDNKSKQKSGTDLEDSLTQNRGLTHQQQTPAEPTAQDKLSAKGMTKDPNALDFEWDGTSVGDVDLAKNTINGKGKFDMHTEGAGGKKDDTDSVERLLKREGEGKYLNDEQAAGVFKALKNGGPDGRGLDASDVMDQVERIGKKHGKESPEMQNYLERIGAAEMSPANKAAMHQVMVENSDPKKKFNGIDGLNNTDLDLSGFLEYTITGKDKKTGKKVEIKVTKDDIASSPYQPGRLQGLNGKDLSHLEDVKIDGRMMSESSKSIKVKVDVNDMNKIASGEKQWQDFEKKGFLSKIGDGLKSIGKGFLDLGKGIVKGVAGLGKGLVNGVGAILKGDFKGALSAVTDGTSGFFKNVAGGVKGVLTGVTSGMRSAMGASLGLIVGDKAANILLKPIEFGHNIGVGLVTSVTDGMSKFTSASANIINGRGSFGKNLLDGASGAIDVVTGVTGGKAILSSGKAIMSIANTGKITKGSLNTISELPDTVKPFEAEGIAANRQRNSGEPNNNNTQDHLTFTS